MGRVVITETFSVDQRDEVVAVDRADGADVQVFDEGGGRFKVVSNFPDVAVPPGVSPPGVSPPGDPPGVSPPGVSPPGDPPGMSPPGVSPPGVSPPVGLNDSIPIPPRDQINVRLSSCRESTMLQKFGVPGNLTIDCSALTGSIKQRVRSNFDVGPFKVTGLDFAVESLLQIFTDVQNKDRVLFEQVKTDGMLCVRAQRHNRGHYSNHSWGTAIDIYFGTSAVPQGIHLTHRGNSALAPFFNQHGWYWGAGFSGDSVDSMHFELAEETILKVSRDQPMFDAGGPVGPDGGTQASVDGVAWCKKVDPAFKQKVLGISQRLGCDPSRLMAAMAFETGETFSPEKQNPTSGAMGLIQFMPQTARGLGTTTDELKNMTAIDQLDFVERYLLPFKGRMNSLSDVYMTILFPKAVGQPESFVLFAQGTRAYDQNKGLDVNHDGVITKGEATSKVQNELDKGLSTQFIG
jgi:hypothetical protein